MERQERRKIVLKARRESLLAVRAGRDDESRSRVGRRVRGHLRQLLPVALTTPRWSAPQAFLEDVALDLAVGEPGIRARTISCRPCSGRGAAEAWNHLLRALVELVDEPDELRMPPLVCERRGFAYAAGEILREAHGEREEAVALLVHGVEHLPVEVLKDLQDVFGVHRAAHADEARATLLLAGAGATPALHLPDLHHLELADYSEAEATATLLLRMGAVPITSLSRPVRFAGGLPALVQALAHRAASEGHLPVQTLELVKAIGPLAEDLRAAVATALTAPATAERFYQLGDGGPHAEDPERDRALHRAGLIRRIRQPGRTDVELRAPALVAFAR